LDVRVDVSWLDPEHLDHRDAAGVVTVLEAARTVDTPHQLVGETTTGFVGRMRHGMDGDPQQVAVTRDPRHRVTGVLRMTLPRWDNTHVAVLAVVVDPDLRRRGLGRRLFEAGLSRALAEGRSSIGAWCFDRTAGEQFLTAMGAARALDNTIRRLDVRAADWARLDREYAAATRPAAGYELVRLPGAVPEELLPAIGALMEAINDAPAGESEVEDLAFSPARIRAYEIGEQAVGRRLYRLVARERASGTLAGETIVAVDGEHPWYAWQQDTSVLRAHRGRRLGLLLKLGMMRWLREAEPQLRTIDTGNAAANVHMIRVNDVLGYRVVARSIRWHRRL
jgi:GNAT superfamily N-acetyltransferase